jgi:cell division protein FtsL
MVRKKISKKEVLVGIAWAIIVILILTFYIWNQIESIRLGYAIGDLEMKLQNLEKDVEKFETIKSALLSLDNVERTAKEKLKLQKPKKEQIVYDNFRP